MERCSRVIFNALLIWGWILNFVFGSGPVGWVMDRLEGYQVGH